MSTHCWSDPGCWLFPPRPDQKARGELTFPQVAIYFQTRTCRIHTKESPQALRLVTRAPFPPLRIFGLHTSFGLPTSFPEGSGDRDFAAARHRTPLFTDFRVGLRDKDGGARGDPLRPLRWLQVPRPRPCSSRNAMELQRAASWEEEGAKEAKEEPGTRHHKVNLPLPGPGLGLGAQETPTHG